MEFTNSIDNLVAASSPQHGLNVVTLMMGITTQNEAQVKKALEEMTYSTDGNELPWVMERIEEAVKVWGSEILHDLPAQGAYRLLGEHWDMVMPEASGEEKEVAGRLLADGYRGRTAELLELSGLLERK